MFDTFKVSNTNTGRSVAISKKITSATSFNPYFIFLFLLIFVCSIPLLGSSTPADSSMLIVLIPSSTGSVSGSGSTGSGSGSGSTSAGSSTGSVVSSTGASSSFSGFIEFNSSSSFVLSNSSGEFSAMAYLLQTTLYWLRPMFYFYI